jgi:hypothetical protein
MPQYGHWELAAEVGDQARERGNLRFGGGNPIQIAHKRNANTVGVVPATVCAHAREWARGVQCAVRVNHKVVRDVGVPATLHAGA